MQHVSRDTPYISVADNEPAPLKELDVIHKATIAKNTQNLPFGAFRTTDRFTDKKKFTCEATRKGPDPYNVQAPNTWLTHSKGDIFQAERITRKKGKFPSSFSFSYRVF
uniref:Uncharacterized protein n=1 Tax=Palpitomonas bilix TaxID=652834 RepID=A0A7S3CWD4_9EUKA|mmetsp:Transcript_10436/g.27352  ORF Transcript_10436/g.27352 Transcript_10436/m.27352 type:complete len:109 (+) Transcript_10436:251-577(+)